MTRDSMPKTTKSARRRLAPKPARSRNTKWAGASLEKQKMKPVEKAVLKTLPCSPAGLTFDDLVDRIARQLNPMVFPLRKTVSRYTKVVQLDLEKRGVIERIPGVTPLTLRMMTKS